MTLHVTLCTIILVLWVPWHFYSRVVLDKSSQHTVKTSHVCLLWPRSCRDEDKVVHSVDNGGFSLWYSRYNQTRIINIEQIEPRNSSSSHSEPRLMHIKQGQQRLSTIWTPRRIFGQGCPIIEQTPYAILLRYMKGLIVELCRVKESRKVRTMVTFAASWWMECFFSRLHANFRGHDNGSIKNI